MIGTAHQMKLKLLNKKVVANYNMLKKGTRIDSRFNITNRVIDFTVSSRSLEIISIKRHILDVSDHMAIVINIKFECKEIKKLITKFNREKLEKMNKKEIIENCLILKGEFHQQVQEIIKEQGLIQYINRSKIYEYKIDGKLAKLLKEKRKAHLISAVISIARGL